jgi:hypothetical protein
MISLDNADKVHMRRSAQIICIAIVIVITIGMPGACLAQDGWRVNDDIPLALTRLRSTEADKIQAGRDVLGYLYMVGRLSARQGQGRALLDSLFVIAESHSGRHTQIRVVSLIGGICERAGAPPVVRGADWVSFFRRLTDDDGATRLFVMHILARHPSHSEAAVSLGEIAVLRQHDYHQFEMALELIERLGPTGMAELKRLEASGGIKNPRAQATLRSFLPYGPRRPLPREAATQPPCWTGFLPPQSSPSLASGIRS